MAGAGRLKYSINHKRDDWKGRLMREHITFEVPADVQVEISIEELGVWVWRPGERPGGVI